MIAGIINRRRPPAVAIYADFTRAICRAVSEGDLSRARVLARMYESFEPTAARAAN